MDHNQSTNKQEPARKRRRRNRLIAVGVVVLLLAALILTPPLINVDRYRRRITVMISQSLGRPVHLDNVSLHLLPIPGFTLQNFVVSEDPAFGYEPVIRANKVEATLRASSLWRRQVEFSTIRFEVDEHGSGPSVNLVRNAAGRWNLEEVLMRASHVETAPTVQQKAGPAPRFPYIEATGARVNIKLGDEKMPYSLTDADFALWLPSPQQWRVRLQGKPTRTDSNVSETGLMLVEGSMKPAGAIASVPVDLHASWRGAALGEASRLLSGNDAGWRGTLFLEMSLQGPINQAALTTHLQLNDLRRADFVPAKTLDITIDCASASNVLTATLTDGQCHLPVDNTTPITLSVAAVDLQHPAAAQAKTSVKELPMAWAFDWVRLFSPRTPATLEPQGAINGELDWNSGARSWQGRLIATLGQTDATNVSKSTGPTDIPSPPVFTFDVNTAPTASGVTVAPPVLRFQSTALHPAPASSFTLSGQADTSSYHMELNGNGTSAHVRALADLLPPLNEGLDMALPKSDKPDTPHNISLSCSRLWSGTQTCEPLVQPEPVHPTRTPHRHR